MFNPFIQKVRPSGTEFVEEGVIAELRKFDTLAEFNFKLMNYSKKSIVPGEQVIKFVLQPEIRVGISDLFGLAFTRLITNAHITILTDKELIMIQDTGGRKWSQDIRYGGTWHYIPLDRIRSVSLIEKEGELITLSINFSAGDNIEKIFSASNGSEVEQLLHHLEKLIPGNLILSGNKPS
jgi:hypothetical protein